MRLVCPKCAAQYEVDLNAIPEDGRDVQCANCGNTWFQEREFPAADALPESVTPRYSLPQDDPADDLSEAPEKEAAPHVRPQAAPVDQSVLDILRQEAEHDAATRETSVSETPVEEQLQAPLDEPDPEPEAPENLALRAREARNRAPAHRRPERRLHLSTEEENMLPDDDGQDPAGQPAEDLGITPAPRRARPVETPPRDLPDVDELNSTLRSAKDKSRAKDRSTVSAKTRSRGNSLGFYSAVLIFLILLAAYILKPQIVTALPEAAPILDAYTDFVDVVRHRLADGVVSLIEAARNLMAQFL